jgi:DNA-directed RNA polymerase specialized sigma24 family protein
LSRPKRTSLDPGSFERGSIARQTAFYDNVEAEVRPMAMVLQRLMERVQEPDRTAVELVTMQGFSLYEAAEIMEADLGYLADSKTIWRWAKRGERTLRQMMERSGFYKEDEDD